MAIYTGAARSVMYANQALAVFGQFESSAGRAFGRRWIVNLNDALRQDEKVRQCPIRLIDNLLPIAGKRF